MNLVFVDSFIFSKTEDLETGLRTTTPVHKPKIHRGALGGRGEGTEGTWSLGGTQTPVDDGRFLLPGAGPSREDTRLQGEPLSDLGVTFYVINLTSIVLVNRPKHPTATREFVHFPCLNFETQAAPRFRLRHYNHLSGPGAGPDRRFPEGHPTPTGHCRRSLGSRPRSPSRVDRNLSGLFERPGG